MWILVIVIAVIIGAILGGREGAIAGGVGCGYILFQIFIWGLGLFIMIKLFSFLFS